MMPEFRVAPPLTRQQIEDIAWDVRYILGLKPFERVPVAQILENALPILVDGYEFRVDVKSAMGGAEAVTDSVRPTITFEQGAYRDLARDMPRARMTGAHELGHLLLHTGQTAFAFLGRRDRRLDPEVQADIFAEAFLMPECAFRRVKSIAEAMERFGVSKDAACFRARKLKMRHLLGDKNLRNRPKRKERNFRHAP